MNVDLGMIIDAFAPGDQVKSLDWTARKAKRLDAVPKEVLEEVLAKNLTLVESSEQ